MQRLVAADVEVLTNIEATDMSVCSMRGAVAAETKHHRRKREQRAEREARQKEGVHMGMPDGVGAGVPLGVPSVNR
jgi:ketosteroid isomerase-like protein